MSVISTKLSVAKALSCPIAFSLTSELPSPLSDTTTSVEIFSPAFNLSRSIVTTIEAVFP